MTQIVARRQRNSLPFGSLPDMTRSVDEKMPPMICRAVFEEMFILANGDIVCASPDPNGRRIYGNVHHDRVSDIFDGAMYREIRSWQLSSQPVSWCPVIVADCPRRLNRPTRLDVPDKCRIVNVEIEPISACNLRCPECFVTLDFQSPLMSERARKLLSLETMNDIVRQLPDLQKIRLYGFGEPFLHKDLIEFLRETKRCRPDVHIGISTNGIPLSTAKIDAIADECLADTMTFAIDGVDQQSYARYRVGGDVAKALDNLKKMARAVDRAGTRDRVDVVWQYILFEWNDGDDELRRAAELAKSLDVRIDWLPTHSENSSRRYLVGSKELERLQGRRPSTGGGTAEVKLRNSMEQSDATTATYLASIDSDVSTITVIEGRSIRLDVTITNLSKSEWLCASLSSLYQKDSGIRVGVLAQDNSGRTICDLWGGPLPEDKIPAGGSATLHIHADNPLPPGEYRILVDLVDEAKCWFHERGSAALLCETMVLGADVPFETNSSSCQMQGRHKSGGR